MTKTPRPFNEYCTLHKGMKEKVGKNEGEKGTGEVRLKSREQNKKEGRDINEERKREKKRKNTKKVCYC